jgi:lysophospholipase L1-like esterase
MVRIANENNIKLVFVRVKVNTHAADPKLDAYISSLSAYLQNNQAFILDYGQDARLTRDLFLDSIHLNPAGQIVFTQMVADGLNELFSKE